MRLEFAGRCLARRLPVLARHGMRPASAPAPRGHARVPLPQRVNHHEESDRDAGHHRQSPPPPSWPISVEGATLLDVPAGRTSLRPRRGPALRPLLYLDHLRSGPSGLSNSATRPLLSQNLNSPTAVFTSTRPTRRLRRRRSARGALSICTVQRGRVRASTP
jgi:hypothetical protein